MRSAIAATGAALLAIAMLGGCGSNDETPNPAETQVAKDRIYLELAHEAWGPGASDEGLLTIRHQTCAVLDNEPTRVGWASIITAAVNNGADADTAGSLTALAVTSLCPQHEGLVQ